jgi:hypothetical protein
MSSYFKSGNIAFNHGDYRLALHHYASGANNIPELANFYSFGAKIAERRKSGCRLSSKVCIGIVTPPHTLFLAHTIRKTLDSLGIVSNIYERMPERFPYDYYIVLCAQIYSDLPPGEKRICFQLEQTTNDRWMTDNYLRVLNSSLAVLEYSLENIRRLRGLGVRFPLVHYLPIGPSAIVYKSKNHVRKDIDVLFYGDDLSSERRRDLLARISKSFDVEVVNNKFGSEMEAVLARAKIVLNIHYYDKSLLEMPRIMESISYGATVVSETSHDQDDHNELPPLVQFFEQGNAEDGILAIRKALQKAPLEGEDIEGQLEGLESNFEFMFARFLIAINVLPLTYVENIKIDNSKLHGAVCLSMPETIDRYDFFNRNNHIDARTFPGIRRMPGWIGCGLSYKVLASAALRSRKDSLLVVEDDVEFPSTILHDLMVIRGFLSKWRQPWDLFSGFIANLHQSAKVLDVIDYEGKRFLVIDKMTSTVMNIYSREFLLKLCQWDPEHVDPTKNTIDRYVESLPNLRVITTFPFIAGHREDTYSSLWHFQNSQYREMIESTNRMLEEKIQDFLAENRRAF